MRQKQRKIGHYLASLAARGKTKKKGLSTGIVSIHCEKPLIGIVQLRAEGLHAYFFTIETVVLTPATSISK